MKALLILTLLTPISFAFGQTNPFGTVSGDYKVVSCQATTAALQQVCNSKTAFIGNLPGPFNEIGLRFVDVDYVVSTTQCIAPVVCMEHAIHSERQRPEFPGQTLQTDIQFTEQDEETLVLVWRRMLIPKIADHGQDIDGGLNMVLKRMK